MFPPIIAGSGGPFNYGSSPKSPEKKKENKRVKNKRQNFIIFLLLMFIFGMLFTCLYVKINYS